MEIFKDRDMIATYDAATRTYTLVLCNDILTYSSCMPPEHVVVSKNIRTAEIVKNLRNMEFVITFDHSYKYNVVVQLEAETWDSFYSQVRIIIQSLMNGAAATRAHFYEQRKLTP